MGEDILVCALVQKAQYVVPGSIESECADCGGKVLMAPSSQELARGKTVIILCLKCTLDRADKAPEPPEIMITQEAAEEVRAWRRRN